MRHHRSAQRRPPESCAPGDPFGHGDRWHHLKLDDVFTTRTLFDAGLSRRAITAAVAAGDLIRVRRGCYLTRDSSEKVRAAARFGSLTCASGLAESGVWTMPEGSVHVRVAADSRASPTGFVVHRRALAPLHEVEPPAECLRDMLRCSDDLSIVVAADSLLNLRKVGRRELEALLVGTARGRRILGRVDGRAESGIETIARVRLRARRVRVRPQVTIAGVGRVDLLVGDRLVIELDGRRWHDNASTFESDRRRDALLVTRGYIVLRYSYHRVMHEWESVEAEVLSLIRRDRHVARSGAGRHSNA